MVRVIRENGSISRKLTIRHKNCVFNFRDRGSLKTILFFEKKNDILLVNMYIFVAFITQNYFHSILRKKVINFLRFEDFPASGVV